MVEIEPKGGRNPSQEGEPPYSSAESEAPTHSPNPNSHNSPDDESLALVTIRRQLAQLNSPPNQPSSSQPQEMPPPSISTLNQIALQKLRWRVLSLIPTQKTREQAIREKIHWAQMIDNTHPRTEPLLAQGILNITQHSRQLVDHMIGHLAAPDHLDLSTATVALTATIKDDGQQSQLAAIERIPEPSGPCYIAYEIFQDKITGDAAILSHGLVDTDTTDTSDVSTPIRTSCSWKQERFASTDHPRAAAIIFNALAEHVLSARFKKDPDNIDLITKPQLSTEIKTPIKEVSTPQPKVAIIILNWNGRDDTLECLKSLSHLTYHNAEIIVVDNASSDNSVTRIRNKYPGVNVVENRTNLGFAEGNNIGIKYALDQGAEYVLVLNNDTTVESNFLEDLVRVGQSNLKIGAVIPKILLQHNRQKLWFAGVRSQEGYYSYLQPDSGKADFIRPSDIASGCAFMLKKETLEQVGLFDPRFFFAFEDVDLSYRIRTAGFEIYYAPNAHVFHKTGQSTDLNSTTGRYYFTRNLCLALETQYPKLSQFHRKIIASYRALLSVGGLVLSGNLKSAGAAFEGYIDYMKGKFGKRGEGMSYLNDQIS